MGKPSARSSWCPARSSTSWSDILRKPLHLVVLLALAAALAPLGGCGFRPLYGDHGAAGGGVVNQLAQIEVVSPETTVGRSLRYDLLDSIGVNGDAPVSPLYRLTLSPTSYTQNVAVQTDATVTRANFVLVTPFTLVSTATNKTLFRSTARARSSYNRVESEFANLSASQDAARRVAETVADDIKLQLSLFFDRQASRDGDAAH